MMPEVELFVGFKVTKEFAELLDNIPADKRDLYIGKGPDYLIEIHDNNNCYLGKNCGELIDSDALEMREKNIYSLLGKLVPEFPYEKTSLTLFPTLK